MKEPKQNLTQTRFLIAFSRKSSNEKVDSGNKGNKLINSKKIK